MKIDPLFERIKKSDGELVQCVLCKGSYNRPYFYRHKKQCMDNKTKANKPMPAIHSLTKKY